MLALHTGDLVAADARLLAEVNLKADESLITGESMEVDKDLAPLAAPTSPWPTGAAWYSEAR